MLEEAKRMSATGWKITAQWTIIGTLCCVAISASFNVYFFRDLTGVAFERVIWVAAGLPAALAAPLFFFLTIKLRELARLNHQLSNAVSYDHLTKVLNRGAFINAVKDAIRLLGRDGRSDAEDNPFYNLYIVADIDFFKHVNDKFGHPVGDAALQHVSDIMRDAVRSHDYVGRLGGEEFGLFLTHVKFDDAHYIADRIRRTIANHRFACDGQFIGLTVSMGGVVFQGDLDYSALYKTADAHLYEAKSAGRNRSIITPFIQVDEVLAPYPEGETIVRFATMTTTP